MLNNTAECQEFSNAANVSRNSPVEVEKVPNSVTRNFRHFW